MSAVVTTNPDVMHGTPCFAGTRVPVKSLFDHLLSNYTVDAFLEQFPSVQRHQVDELLEQLRERTEREAERVTR